MNVFKFLPTPLYTKLAMVLICVIAAGFIAILGKEVLSPMLFAFLLSIVLLPMADFFEKKWRFRRGGAAGLAVVVLVILLGLLIYLIGSQVSDLASDWPQFKQQLAHSIDSLHYWISVNFHINLKKQKDFIDTTTSGLLTASTSFIGATVMSVSSMLLFLVFTMINTFFLLFYRRHIVTFLVNVFKEKNKATVFNVIEQVQYIIRRYILGLLLEMAIVSTALCLTFWLLDIKYGFLLGLLTGILNIIPYVGIFTGLLFSVLVTFATAAATSKIILVMITVVIVHLVDSNVLLPFVVASKVKINGQITLLGVIIGEMMWGIPGMFLSIPVIAIAKIIFDQVDSLKPWGLLLGDEKSEPPPPATGDEKGIAVKALVEEEIKKETDQ